MGSVEQGESELPPMVAAVPAEPPLDERVAVLLGDDLAGRVGAALKGYRPRPTEVGLPVLMESGGWPWEMGCRWMRDSFAASRTATRTNYASTVLAWAWWCWENGVDPAAPTFNDLMDYRDEMLGEGGVKASTWNTYLASILSWLRWLEAQDGVKRVPDSTRKLKMAVGGELVTAVSVDDFIDFRDVGLRGLDIGGVPDVDFPGVTGERDGVFADLLVSTGMRCSELAHLLLLELPARRADRRGQLMFLPGPLCKGGKPRHVEVADGALRRYGNFQQTEWPNVVAAAQSSLRRRNDLLVVRDVGDGGRVLFGSGWRKTETLSLRERRRLVLTSDVAAGLGLPVQDGWLVSAAAFPATKGVLQLPASWSGLFRVGLKRANAKRGEVGMPPLPRITPHVLRHTYGVEYLRAALAVMNEQDWQAIASDDERKLRRFFMNPLTELRERLGHAQMDTTLRYLTVLKQEDPVRHTPWTSWADALFEGGA